MWSKEMVCSRWFGPMILVLTPTLGGIVSGNPVSESFLMHLGSAGIITIYKLTTIDTLIEAGDPTS